MNIKIKSPKRFDPLAELEAMIAKRDSLVASQERISSELDVLEQNIREFIKEHGEPVGACHVVSLRNTQVVLRSVAGRRTVNWDAFSAQYPKKYARLCSPQIDDAKVTAALREGWLPKALLAKFVVHGQGHTRLQIKKDKQ